MVRDSDRSAALRLLRSLLARVSRTKNSESRCVAVGSGQWAVGSGQWAVGRGQWAVGSGQWAAVTVAAYCNHCAILALTSASIIPAPLEPAFLSDMLLLVLPAPTGAAAAGGWRSGWTCAACRSMASPRCAPICIQKSLLVALVSSPSACLPDSAHMLRPRPLTAALTAAERGGCPDRDVPRPAQVRCWAGAADPPFQYFLYRS